MKSMTNQPIDVKCINDKGAINASLNMLIRFRPNKRKKDFHSKMQSLSNLLNYDIINGLAKHPRHHLYCQCLINDIDYLETNGRQGPEIENLSLFVIYEHIKNFFKEAQIVGQRKKQFIICLFKYELFSYANLLSNCEELEKSIPQMTSLLISLLRKGVLERDYAYSSSTYFSYLIEQLEEKNIIQFLSSLDLWLILLKLMLSQDDFYSSVPIFKNIFDYVCSLCPWQLWKKDISRIQQKVIKSGILNSNQQIIFQSQIQNYLNIQFSELIQFPSIPMITDVEVFQYYIKLLELLYPNHIRILYRHA